MPRMVMCAKFGKELPGLERPPIKGELGQRIYENVSQQAWELWAPQMTLYPHDHRMWAAIGIYAGREDNAFYRRQPEGLASSGGKELGERDVLLLGDDVIHSVTNPSLQCTGAIHVYGGDFVNQPRTEWDPVTFEPRPYDLNHTREQFALANAAAGLG